MKSDVLDDPETAAAHNKGYWVQSKRHHVRLAAAVLCLTSLLLLPIPLTLLSNKAVVSVTRVRSSHQVRLTAVQVLAYCESYHHAAAGPYVNLRCMQTMVVTSKA